MVIRPIGRLSASHLCLLIALACMVIFSTNTLLYAARGPGTGADSFKYLLPAVSWLRGHGYKYLGEQELVFPPGYGLRTLPLYLAGLSIVQSAVAANIICLAIACLFIYLICRFYVSKVFSLLAVLFVVANPFIMDYTTRVMSELTFMAAVAGAAYFVLRFLRRPERNPANLAVAGVFAGWAVLTRTEGMGIALILVAFTTVDLVVRRPAPRLNVRFALHLAACALIFTLPFVALYAPYVAYLSKHVGHFAWNGKSEMDVIVGHARMQAGFGTLDFDLYKQKAMEAGVRPSLSDHLHRIGVNLIRYASYASSQGRGVVVVLLAFVAIGAWQNGFRRIPFDRRNLADTVEALTFCALMFAPIIPMAFYLAEPRMFIPYNMFLIIGSIVLMDRIVSDPSGATRPAAPWLYGFAAVAAMLGYGIYSSVQMASRRLPEYPLQQGARAIASLAEVKPVNVMALRRSGTASYYANRGRVRIHARFIDAPPELTVGAVAGMMRQHNLRYLLLDSTFISTRPSLSALWTCAPARCPKDLHLVGEEPDTYRIFELPPDTRPVASPPPQPALSP